MTGTNYTVYFHVMANALPAALVGAFMWYCTSSTVKTRIRSGRPLARGLGHVPVGGGWSFFLQRTPVPGKPLFMQSGRIAASGRWYAGTTIGEVQEWLCRRGKTLTSHPSILDATLGGWIASGSHGSGGTLWKKCLGKVSLYDQETDAIMTHIDPSIYFRDDQPIAVQRRYVITEVEVLPVDDVACALKVSKVREEEGIRNFLQTPSYLRLLQIGARGIMSLLWVPTDEPPPPHKVDQTWLWWHADILSISQGAREREAAWFAWPVPRGLNTTMRLSDANHFTPTPPLVLTAIGLHFTNFEVFAHVPGLAADTLHELCLALGRMFETSITGRCELRYGASGKLFLDFACLNAGLDVQIVFTTIASVLGQDLRVWLHKGKAQVPTFPLKSAAEE